MKYLLGADIGTTSLKAAVFDETGKMIKSATKDYTLIVSGDTVEFPAEDYFELFLSAYNEITEGIKISALSVDTQCETMILADENGKPLRNAIVWLDNRAAAEAEEIKAFFGNKKVSLRSQRLGLPQNCFGLKRTSLKFSLKPIRCFYLKITYFTDLRAIL